MTHHLRHGRVELALHQLSEKGGPTLLLLHALHESSRDWGDLPRHWPGAVFGLDFSGHGGSDRIRGGAYVAEVLLGDADVALAHLGAAAVVGAGIGAYVALLLAGTRSDQVPAALLLPGAGLAGGGADPNYEAPFAAPIAAASAGGRGARDPFLCLLESDVRPPDYARRFASTARRLLLVEPANPPPWWREVASSASAERATSNRREALQRLAYACGG
jgi:pimeloyl-ACP methyl ester carboxylesterase